MKDDQKEPQLVPKLLLQVSVRELHNSPVSDPNDGRLKDARDEDDNIIISDSTIVTGGTNSKWNQEKTSNE